MNDNSSAEILLVEDNPYDLELALRALKKAHLVNRIHIARDGQEVIDYIFCQGEYALRKIAVAPKVIFLDLKLPKIDGLEVLKQIKADSRTKNIPIVALTSSQEDNDIKKSYDLGVNSYIVKPVHFEQFVDALKAVGMYWLTLNHSPKLVA